MLHLPQRKSTFNFFESFSDLVFCTLVLFLVLVLFLAMNVNQKVQAVRVDEEAVAAQSAALEEDVAALELERAEAERLAEEARLAALEAERQQALQEQQLAVQREAVERERQRYEQALGANRFTDPDAAPRLVVAYQWEDRRVLVHPVPAWLTAQLNTTPAGLSDAQRADYQAALRGRFLVTAAEVEPLTAKQYRALVRAMSLGIQPMTQRDRQRPGDLGVAFRVASDGTPTTFVSRVLPGGNADRAGVLPDDELLALDDALLTPDTAAGVLAGYAPGDQARLLLKREGRVMDVDFTFQDTRLVELVEAYRTDLSMVASGAVDAQYRYLWEPALADALRNRLQQDEASAAVWQNYSRTEGKRAVPGRPTLLFDLDPSTEEVVIERERFSAEQFRRVLEALGGGGVVVEYRPARGPTELPAWVMGQCLQPTGFVNRAPQLELLIDPETAGGHDSDDAQPE